MIPLCDDLLLKVVAEIHDPVTTTDELIPSGETSSYRSNPLKLAEFTLSRKAPDYVGRAKEVYALELSRRSGKAPDALSDIYDQLRALGDYKPVEIQIGSVIYANKPGDGSAREQAASCQRVLGGSANIAKEYATKRYRSNLINWGMLPLLLDGELPFGRRRLHLFAGYPPSPCRASAANSRPMRSRRRLPSLYPENGRDNR